MESNTPTQVEKLAEELFIYFDSNYDFFPLPICFDAYEEQKELFRRKKRIEDYVQYLFSSESTAAALKSTHITQGYSEEYKGWVALFKDEEEYLQYLKWRSRQGETEFVYVPCFGKDATDWLIGDVRGRELPVKKLHLSELINQPPQKV